MQRQQRDRRTDRQIRQIDRQKDKLDRITDYRQERTDKGARTDGLASRQAEVSQELD